MSPDPETELLGRVAEGLSRRAGFRFNLSQPHALQTAIGRRRKALELKEARAYSARLDRDEPEWERLAEEVAVHETSFFRHAGQFRALTETILPELARLRAGERRLRVWSAACATGEEPYSIAIAIQRLNLGPGWDVRILATDLSLRALKTAERAVFHPYRLRSLPPGELDACFEPHGEQYRLKEPYRSMVEFRQLNLAGPLPASIGQMDVVFCENVLIYFIPETSRRVVAQIHGALREGGYLFLGYAETIYGMSNGFVPVLVDDTYLYRRVKTAPASPPGLVPAPRRGAPATPAPAAPAVAKRRTSTSAVLRHPQVPPSEASILARIAADDLPGAVRLAEERVSLSPGLPKDRLLLARLYSADGRPAEAADTVRRILLDDPVDAASYLLLGILCYRQNELSEAVAELERALYLDPKLALAWFHLGNVHQQRGDQKLAARAYRNAARNAAHFTPEWDSGFTRELLLRVAEQNLARLTKLGR